MAIHYLEESLIAELRKKNDSALRQLYHAHYPMVLHMVVANSGTEAEAKDVYQEAIIHFYERLQEADFVLTCKIKTYLYAVCRKLWLQRLSARHKFVRIDELEQVEGIEEAVTDIEVKEKNFFTMDLSLEKLGEPCRTILEDYYLRNLTMDEITLKFGYTNADNTKNQKYKCLQRLKKIFQSENGY
jgi:RNA polymerase sigma factor (sigma-70 family)